MRVLAQIWTEVQRSFVLVLVGALSTPLTIFATYYVTKRYSAAQIEAPAMAIELARTYPCESCDAEQLIQASIFPIATGINTYNPSDCAEQTQKRQLTPDCIDRLRGTLVQLRDFYENERKVSISNIEALTKAISEGAAKKPPREPEMPLLQPISGNFLGGGMLSSNRLSDLKMYIESIRQESEKKIAALSSKIDALDAAKKMPPRIYGVVVVHLVNRGDTDDLVKNAGAAMIADASAGVTLVPEPLTFGYSTLSYGMIRQSNGHESSAYIVVKAHSAVQLRLVLDERSSGDAGKLEWYSALDKNRRKVTVNIETVAGSVLTAFALAPPASVDWPSTRP